jgi:uncharacterized damage-inducible protein DinB
LFLLSRNPEEAATISKEHHMQLAELFLDQLAKESDPTRRILERVPEGRNDWRPHGKSMPLGYLASHIASLPAWITMTISTDFLEFQSPEAKQFAPPPCSTPAELVQLLDASVAKARESLSTATEDHLMRPWQFRFGGRVIHEAPRYAVIRDTVFSHLAHHRAQLGVYLRLNDIALPGTYGPSADEPAF